MSYADDVSRRFIRENVMDIVCEPSGEYLFELEMRRDRPVYMKLIE